MSSTLKVSLRALLLFILGFAPCIIYSEKKESDGGETYQLGQASRDGIGKFYMGREISQVMGHLGASWLERPKREQEERTDLLIKSMNIQPTDHIADIGAGSGYFSFRMSKLLPQGKVFAVDISPQMLGIIRAKIKDNY